MQTIELFFYNDLPIHNFEYCVKRIFLEDRVYSRDELIELEPSVEWIAVLLFWDRDIFIDILKENYPDEIIKAFWT